MFVNHDREKLVEAVVFFAASTRGCGKIKLLKLLYLLDFSHFREAGRSVTGLDYRAWRMGPVPVNFYQEWDSLSEDLSAAVEIVPERVIDFVRETVQPRRAFDGSYFTRRELKLMRGLAERYQDDLSRGMVDVTHAEFGPWAQIWDDGRGDGERIPYVLAVGRDDPFRDAVLESAAQFRGIAAAHAR